MTEVLKIIDVIGLLLFCLYIVQQTAAALQRKPRVRVESSGAQLNFLIPALNEAQVIGATLENLRRTVPSARIVVIDDASDDQTAQIVLRAAQGDPAITLLQRQYPEARQNKGRAMNWAVRGLLRDGFFGDCPDQQVIVVLDADGRVQEDFAGQVWGAFADPNVMAAQGWMRFRQTGARPGPAGLVSRMLLFQQDLEAFITGHIQRYRVRGGTASLTGNGQCMRVSYVAQQLDAGTDPWPEVLLEDFASAVEIRLHSPEHRIAYLPTHISQQGMVELSGFIRQRVRWTQGAMECLPYLRRLWRTRASWITRLDFSYFILGPWLNLLLIISFASQGLRRVFGGQGLTITPEVGLLLTVLPLIMQLNWVLRYIRERRLPLRYLPFAMVSLPVYSFALLSSLPKAYFNHFTGRRGWYKSVRHDDATLELPERHAEPARSNVTAPAASD